MTVSITPVRGVPAVRPGDDLAALLLAALAAHGPAPQAGDVLVVCQKVVSKAEGRLVRLDTVDPSPFARQIAAGTQGKDPRVVEVILRETRRIVRMDRGHLIVETGPGWICANAGVDESNSPEPGTVVLLPQDPDASARRLRAAIAAATGAELAVIITDTFGRPWREGQIDVALGVAGMAACRDHRGERDLAGRALQHTVLAQADALAAAAGLVMGKADGVPAALVRGYAFAPGPGSGRDLLRPPALDLFR